jgi:gamma-glutamylaminecyclotransferase
MMMNEPGNGLKVYGELYEVTMPQLAALERLEAVGRPGNFRVRIEVEFIATGERSGAWAFMKSRELARPVHTPMLENYDHDARFVGAP